MLQFRTRWISLPNLAFALLVAASAHAQTEIETLSQQDPRRSPAVEIFHRSRDAVVYLTGPTASGNGPSIDEFFWLPHHRETISLGSGFIIHPSGYIIASAHGTERVVIEHVTLRDGTILPAEVVGMARDHDLALLKIDAAKPLTSVTMGKPGDFLIGETVIVIGNPAGLRHTCTQGIVSASDRSIQSAGLPGVTLHGLIQSDAGINPGSSGGPWFDVLGQVIGVTTAIKADSNSIGFAVPVSALREALPDMLDVERLYGLATGLEMQVTAPCMISGVAPSSPAAAIGLDRLDIITRLDGRAVVDQCDFDLALVDRKPGEKLKIEWWRKEKLLAGELVLAARPPIDGAALLLYRYGLTAVPLNIDKAIETSMRVNRGVVITAVKSGAPYNRIQTPPMPGDVLARINNVRPKDMNHVGQLLDRVKPGEPVHFVLLRMKDHVATRVDLVLTLEKKG